MKRYKRTEEDTLMQAIAEMYDFHPKSHKKVLVFDIVDDNGDIISRIGTFWSRWDKQWKYFESSDGLPTFAQTSKHFLSNLFCGKNQRGMIYSAQHGKFKVFRADTEAEVCDEEK